MDTAPISATSGLAGKAALITGAGRGIGRALLSPERSAALLIARLGTGVTGQIWDVAGDLS